MPSVSTSRITRSAVVGAVATSLALLAASPAQAVDLAVPGCQPVDYRLPAGSAVDFRPTAGCVYVGYNLLEGDPTVIVSSTVSTFTVLLTGNAQWVAVLASDSTVSPYYDQWVYSCGATLPSDSSHSSWTLVDYCPQPKPPDVLQQVGATGDDPCSTLDAAALNVGGAEPGGWGRSWAQWVNDGRGGAVCTRTLTYSSDTGHYIVAE